VVTEVQQVQMLELQESQIQAVAAEEVGHQAPLQMLLV
jgi:hypothetical protein